MPIYRMVYNGIAVIPIEQTTDMKNKKLIILAEWIFLQYESAFNFYFLS